MKSKKLLILILSLAVITIIVSGCLKAVDIQPVPGPIDNNQTQDQQTTPDQNQPEDQGYIIEPRGDGWVTFKSTKCGFELSYPEGFKLRENCQKIKSNNSNFRLIAIDKENLSENEDIAHEMSILLDIINIETENLGNWIKETFEEGKSYNEKLGEKFIAVSEEEGVYNVNLKYTLPNKSSSGLFKYNYFQDGDNVYQFSTQIIGNNKDLENLFFRIIKTLKFIE